MSSSLTFEVTGNTGAFVFPEFASLPFFTLLDGFMVELFNEDEFISELKALHKAEPHCLDVIASLAAMLSFTEPEMALTYANHGLSLTSALIPKTFTGSISWDVSSNQAFYKLMHAAILANLGCGLREAALRLDSQAHRPIWLNEKAYGCRCVLLGLKWLPKAVRHRELGAAHEIPPEPRRFSEIFPTRGHC
jgi:hypothetical protein